MVVAVRLDYKSTCGLYKPQVIWFFLWLADCRNHKSFKKSNELQFVQSARHLIFWMNDLRFLQSVIVRTMVFDINGYVCFISGLWWELEEVHLRLKVESDWQPLWGGEIDVMELLLGIFVFMLMQKDSREVLLILLCWLVILIMLHLDCGLVR